MSIREDCRHFASRMYDDGEAARFCVLDLAPEAPWRCPDNCGSYERTVIDGTFAQGSLARSVVESEPAESADAIGDLLDDAEMIVEAAAPEILRDLDGPPHERRRWWSRKKRPKPDAGDDWGLSNR